MRLTHFFPKADRGQVLIAVALMVPVLLGMAAVAVDIGSYADDKRNLQNAADAIALAAAHDMCTPDPHDCSSTAAAQTTADAYAAKNNIDTSHMTVTFLGGNTAPKVRVTISHTHDFSFMRILGIGSKGVAASAASVKVSPGGVPGAVPFGITQATLDAAGGNPVTLKYDSSTNNNGNFGPIDIDGTGANIYGADLQSGSPSIMCSVQMPNCDASTCDSGGAFPSACAENALSCDGPDCDTETGNMKTKTKDAVQYRLDHTGNTNGSGNCDTFDKVFTPETASAQQEIGGLLADRQPASGGRQFAPALAPKTPTPVPTSTPTSTPVAPTATPSGWTGKYTLSSDCNPWAGPGQCPAPSSDTGQFCSRRVIVIPIIDGFGGGKTTFEIQSFALMYLDGFGPGGCQTGNDCLVQGRFVEADVSINAISCSNGAPATCTFDPDSSIHFERLVE